MPVIYAICSWLSFGYQWAESYLDPIRDCYEAFVLWMFFQLLMQYMGGEGALLVKLDDGRLPTRHAFPFSMFFEPVDFSDPSKFVILKRAILQFVIVKPIQVLIIGMLRLVDAYQDGIISKNSGFIYVNLIYNFSVMICMYGLVMFYMTTRLDLADRKPIPKFLCIKAVIFFSFWQSLVIAILYKTGVITENPSRVQDFLTCFEMMVASFAHRYAFGHEEYAEMDSARLPWPAAMKDAFGTKDLVMEIRHTFRGTQFSRYNDLLAPGSSTPLLADTSADRHVNLRTTLQFTDVEENDQMENMYDEARRIGEDHNYKVIA